MPALPHTTSEFADFRRRLGGLDRLDHRDGSSVTTSPFIVCPDSWLATHGPLAARDLGNLLTLERIGWGFDKLDHRDGAFAPAPSFDLGHRPSGDRSIIGSWDLGFG
jgi:hypothetical protein